NAKSPPASNDRPLPDGDYDRPSPPEAADMSDVASEAAALKRWLFDVALPLWWKDGADRVGGGFHEAISLDGRPLARPHRASVLLLRSRPPRLARSLARGAAPRARLFPQAFRHRERDGRVRGRSGR